MLMTNSLAEIPEASGISAFSTEKNAGNHVIVFVLRSILCYNVFSACSETFV